MCCRFTGDANKLEHTHKVDTAGRAQADQDDLYPRMRSLPNAHLLLQQAPVHNHHTPQASAHVHHATTCRNASQALCLVHVMTCQGCSDARHRSATAGSILVTSATIAAAAPLP
jgi:hypothetical protein